MTLWVWVSYALLMELKLHQAFSWTGVAPSYSHLLFTDSPLLTKLTPSLLNMASCHITKVELGHLSSRGHRHFPRSLPRPLLSRARTTIDSRALEDCSVMFLSSIFSSSPLTPPTPLFFFFFFFFGIALMQLCGLTGHKTPTCLLLIFYITPWSETKLSPLLREPGAEQMFSFESLESARI